MAYNKIKQPSKISKTLKTNLSYSLSMDRSCQGLALYFSRRYVIVEITKDICVHI